MPTFYYGFNAELDVTEGLSTVVDPSRHEWWVLLSVIDSTSGIASLPSIVPMLGRLEVPFRVVDSDVAVPLADFVALQEREPFLFGFDEVWVFPHLPVQGKPEGAFQITSEVSLEDERRPGLEEWMLTSGCCAGLGDGVGLNYVAVLTELADAWRP